jgi:cellulose synthase/poly-beta-1,6-N-acetylglucosamine synthase-like glycosyltransferase
VRTADADPMEMRRHLDEALEDVLRGDPSGTAALPVTRRQRWWLIGIGVGLVAAVLVWTTTALAVLATAITLLYLATLIQRWSMVTRSLRADPSVHVPDAVARAVPDHDLPVYSLLVPAFREPSVIDGLVAAIDRLEYPRDRLDVLVLLEEGDDATIDRARAAEVGDHMRMVVVPAGEPRTKPRALDVGLRLARGELVTIYDAEDHPEPLQLRRAAVAFRDAAPQLGCLQARLGFYSGGHNLLTKWFTVEYATWFALFLPGLVARGAPVPLGGTSNHFRMAALR